MIILHFHLQPQFKYELFHTYFTSQAPVLAYFDSTKELSIQCDQWARRKCSTPTRRKTTSVRQQSPQRYRNKVRNNRKGMLAIGFAQIKGTSTLDTKALKHASDGLENMYSGLE